MRQLPALKGPLPERLAAVRELRLHWAWAYLGLPWANGGLGPEAFSCWGLVRWIQREHFGRELPEIPVDADDRDAIVAGMEAVLRSGEWTRTLMPEEGAGVVLRVARDPLHVGVWVNADGGGVLHCVRHSGVWFSTRARLRQQGYVRCDFYVPPGPGAAAQRRAA